MALTTGLAFGAAAQNDKEMTKDKMAMQALEMLYRLETGKITDVLGDWIAADPREVGTLPWEKWIEDNKEDYRDFSHFIRGFDRLSLEAVDNDPDACRLLFRYYKDGSGGFTTESSLWLADDDFLVDQDGDPTGFHKEISNFFDLETDLRLSLTDKNGKPVLIDTDKYARVLRGEKRTEDDRPEVYFGIQAPLTCPYSDISGGYVDLRFYGPQEYDRVEIPVTAEKNDTKPVSLGDETFCLEKTDDTGFVISADPETLERLGGLKYLYRRGGSWWQPASSSTITGNLKDMLEYDSGGKEITFGQWLKKKGIDPDNLDATVEHFMQAEEEQEHTDDKPGIRGKRFESGMTGDALVLYMPADAARKKVLASARIYAPVTGKVSETTLDETLYIELSSNLRRANLRESGAPIPETVDNELFATAVGKFEFPDLKGAPGRLKEGCQLTAQERDALLAPNDRISYAVGVVQAERLMKDKEMESFFSFFYLPERQELLFEAFERGMRTARELFAKAEEKAGNEVYAADADLTDLTKAFRLEAEKAKEEGPARGAAFDYGMEAFGLYRSCAVCDLPQVNTDYATGRLLDVPAALQGFRDYIQKQLKMGVQYASSILCRRAPAVMDLGNREPAEGGYSDKLEYLQAFQEVRFLDPDSGQPAFMQSVVARLIQRPQEVIEQGISGRVNAEVTIEADGSVGEIAVIGTSHPALTKVVLDGLYRLRCTPAMVGNQGVATKLIIPVIFPE